MRLKCRDRSLLDPTDNVCLKTKASRIHLLIRRDDFGRDLVLFSSRDWKSDAAPANHCMINRCDSDVRQIDYFRISEDTKPSPGMARRPHSLVALAKIELQSNFDLGCSPIVMVLESLRPWFLDPDNRPLLVTGIECKTGRNVSACRLFRSARHSEHLQFILELPRLLRHTPMIRPEI